MQVETSFDFRTDSNKRDPDSHSPTLRRYHKHLWSKPLPNGRLFDLSDATPGAYLHHRSSAGEFWLASDSVMQTFTRWAAVQHLVTQLPNADVVRFQTITYTIGGMMIFPGNRIDGKQTINGARGFNRSIADRMDLTLECIRRHYQGLTSPLGATLERYGDFFALFENFEGYIDFFLLQDLVNSDRTSVRFFVPFNDFSTPAVPRELEAYKSFARSSIEFVEARNSLISKWVDSHPART